MCLVKCSEISDHFENCDFFQNVIPNKTYDIFSPGYENASNYPSNTTCRWTAIAPAGHNLRLNCKDVYMPSVRIINYSQSLVLANKIYFFNRVPIVNQIELKFQIVET